MSAGGDGRNIIETERRYIHDILYDLTSPCIILKYKTMSLHTGWAQQYERAVNMTEETLQELRAQVDIMKMKVRKKYYPKITQIQAMLQQADF